MCVIVCISGDPACPLPLLPSDALAQVQQWTSSSTCRLPCFHEPAACGAALCSLSDALAQVHQWDPRVLAGFLHLRARCLWCGVALLSRAFRLSALRGWDRPTVLHPLALAVSACLQCIGSGLSCILSSGPSTYNVMDARDNPRRSRSRSRSIRRIGSCDSCPACAVNRGILLRILHLVQEQNRSTSTGPTSVGSGRPALDLAEVFAGTIDQASILMAQPRTAALAVRHLESRCDSIVRSLDALEASVHRRRD